MMSSRRCSPEAPCIGAASVWLVRCASGPCGWHPQILRPSDPTALSSCCVNQVAIGVVSSPGRLHSVCPHACAREECCRRIQSIARSTCSHCSSGKLTYELAPCRAIASHDPGCAIAWPPCVCVCVRELQKHLAATRIRRKVQRLKPHTVALGVTRPVSPL